jgi:hypothetical protein
VSARPERVAELLSELEQVGEHLADLALDLLHEALGDQDPKASPAARSEKVVTRARRSVEKAGALLRSLERDLEAEG